MSVLAVLRALWGLLRSPLGLALALVAVAVLALSWADARAFRRGVSVTEAKWQAMLAESASKARAVEAKNEAAGQSIAAKLDTAKVEIRWRTKTLIERIPSDAPDPARAGVPGWLVGLHDEAASGLPGVSDAPGKPDDPASTVTDARLAEVVIDNYGRCHANSEQLVAFQEWARATGLAR